MFIETLNIELDTYNVQWDESKQMKKGQLLEVTGGGGGGGVGYKLYVENGYK